MDLNVFTLPENVEDLRSIIVAYHNENAILHNENKNLNDEIKTLNKENKTLKREIAYLEEQIKVLKACLYGRKTEKIPPKVHINQKSLFDMPEPEEVPEKEEIEVQPHKRRKPGRKPIPEDLPRKEVIVDIPEEEKTCSCGAEMIRIGEEVSEKLDIIPAKIQVIRTIRPKYACKECEGSASEEEASVKVAPAPPELIPGSIATAGLLAYILTSKFVDHIPFYRQEQQFLRLGVEISRANMANWAMKVSEACIPIMNLMKEKVLEGEYIHIDETTVQVLKEPGRAPTTKSYMWIFKRGDPECPVLIYEYHPTRSGDVALSFLDGYRGYVQTDGYSGYDFLDRMEGIEHIGCWAHARRKFIEAKKGQGGKKTGSADIALGFIQKLYRVERKAKDMSPEERHKIRQKESIPLMDAFHKWLIKRSSQVPPKGLMGKAIGYTLNQWDRLTGYLKHGMLSMDNNAAENAIRPFVVGRKNWLFSGTPEGAEASALLYSLIETAKANGLEPYAYLRYLFTNLPLAKTLEDYEALLPWNLNPRAIAP